MPSSLHLEPAAQIIDRTDELALVEDKLDIIRFGSTVFQAIINFFGVVGIGKTELLHQIERHCQDKKVPVVFADLGAETYQAPAMGRLAIMEAIIAVASQENSAPPRQFRRKSDELRQFLAQQMDEDGNLKDDEMSNQQREEQGRAVEREFQVFMTKRLGKNGRQPLVLLFDETDKARPEFLDWLEETIVSPLVRTDRVLAIFAGRSLVRWKRFEVRRRVHQYRLMPFSIAQTREQIQNYAGLSDKIIRLTFGHPFANRRVAEQVQLIEIRENETITEANFDKYRLRLMEELANILIHEYILQDVPGDLKGAFKVISTLRQFDVNALRVILPAFLPSQFKGKGGGYYLSMIARMVETTLVEWDSAKKGYALDPTIRKMLALHIQLSDYKQYLRINEAAIALYEDWIARIPENRSGFMIEWLYHRSNVLLVQGKSDQEIGRELGKGFGSYLEEFYKGEDGTSTAMKILEELKNDRDMDED